MLGKNIEFCSIVIPSIAALMACSSNKSNTASIINEDERAVFISSELKEKVGTLNFNNIPVCTVFASAKDEITTDAHCLQNHDIDLYSVILNGKSLKPRIKYLYGNADVVKMAVDGVDKYLVEDIFVSSLNHFIVSFAIDKNGLVTSSQGSAASFGHPGVIKHTFDTLPGASGSPILQGDKVVGIHVGSFTENGNLFNLAVIATDVDFVDLSKLSYAYESFWSKLDPTDRNSELRRGLAGLDPTSTESISICGDVVSVPVLLAAACKGSVALLPEGCTVLAATTVGGTCLAAAGAVVASCGATVGAAGDLASKCVEKFHREGHL